MGGWHLWAFWVALSVFSCRSGSHSWPEWQPEHWLGCQNSQILEEGEKEELLFYWIPLPMLSLCLSLTKIRNFNWHNILCSTKSPSPFHSSFLFYDTSALPFPSLFPLLSPPSVCLTEAFALVGGTVNKHLSRDDIAKGQEHLQHLRVTELLRQVVDEDVAALWTWDTHTYTHIRQSVINCLRLWKPCDKQL